jgi:ribosomal protein L2
MMMPDPANSATPSNAITLAQLPIGTWHKVIRLAAGVDRDFSQSSIEVGESLRLLSRSASGSTIVQLSSGVQIGLNRELTQHIWLENC